MLQKNKCFFAAVLFDCSIYFILLQLSTQLQENSATGVCVGGAYANFRG